MATNKSTKNTVKFFGEQHGVVLRSETQEYTLDRVVGSGTFGIVASCHDADGGVFAMKRVVQDRRYKVRVPRRSPPEPRACDHGDAAPPEPP